MSEQGKLFQLRNYLMLFEILCLFYAKNWNSLASNYEEEKHLKVQVEK